jgi:hypothetical protein
MLVLSIVGHKIMPHLKHCLRRFAAWAVIVAAFHRILVWALFYTVQAGFHAGEDMRSIWTAAAILDYPVLLIQSPAFQVFVGSVFLIPRYISLPVLFVSLCWSLVVGIVAAAPIFWVMPHLRRYANGPLVGLGLVGLLIGGFVAFLLRPAIPLIGQQLAFEHVITRGANLKRMDEILALLAQRSFNMMLAGAILGAVVGALVGFFVSQQRRATRNVETDDAVSL